MTGKAWSQPDTDRLIDLHKSGMKMTDIANAMGVSVCKARGRLTRLGLVGGKKARRLKDEPPKPRATTGGSWDSRTFAPYPQWKIENQAKRRMGNASMAE